ncbi:MAG: FAD-dependent oxidoreductase [Deltaproteobacteria bacterium]|jgi:heterodisulfide reductase subunit A-like polyferredoxin|nr:FAD-dependent oxidoreductase [Deltaproteobacteria bacterium]
MGEKKEKIGAVLVVGGGIAGIQASLELAEMGFYVYLAEKNPAIGGRMAQLDKVFPTNDCSMCIISPKLNDIGGHINIEPLNNAELLELSGEAGNFKARILQRPRYLDGDKCTACGDCLKVCPVDLPNEFNEGLNERKVAYKTYAQAYPNSFSLTKESVSPCVVSCPAHVNAHAYVSLAGQGRFQEALEVVLDVLPLPGTLGRICAHPCEAKCRRGLLEGPLDIKNIKRLAAERGNLEAAGKEIFREPLKEGLCAVVGSGPAGLSAVYHLRRLGIKSVIFEKERVAGGALRLGVPDYRLPPEKLQEEIDFILGFSEAEIRFEKALGRDFTLDSLFQDGFKAVFLATGAHRDQGLTLAGSDPGLVVSGVSFLKKVNLPDQFDGEPLPDLKGKKVLVLGGGNVALDSARSAVRLGAEVTLAYRRGRDAMPAWPWEVEEAEEEGVRLLFWRAPLKFQKKKGRIYSSLVRTRAAGGDPKDRRAALENDLGDVLRESFDLVVGATGQLPSSEALKNESGIRFGRGGRVESDPLTMETGRAGVFAGGDLSLGPALAIDAVAAGKAAALSISRHLAGEDLRRGREEMKFTGDERYRELPEGGHYRNKVVLRPPRERVKDFNEFDPGLTLEAGTDEARRCAACGACCNCYRCVKACLPGALTRETHLEESRILDLEVGAVVLASGFAPFEPGTEASWRYLDSPNVVTALEFERILSASGPFKGRMVRPGDEKEPRKIAWIQCVGSREANRCDRGYCSSVCCMYAMKEAVVAMEHAGGPDKLQGTIFHMDIRAHGKDFEKYYNRAKESGVRFTRSRIHTLTPLPDGDLRVEYIDEKGGKISETFDMVVLSIGIQPPGGLKKTAEILGVDLNEEGFVRAGDFDLVRTNRSGIYACGAATEPKDIPATVVEAQAAAAAAASGVAEVRFTRTKTRFYPEERDSSGEAPRIGVFVCHCGINIASVVDVESVAEYARSLPFVELSSTNLFTCSSDTQAKIRDAIVERSLNRVVVASCSPRTHEAMFRETLAQAGLNKFLFEMANIRDQDSWVHQKEPERATAKAKDLVRGAVAKAAFLEPMFLTRMDLTPEALVVGGGVAGMSAALSLANLGFKTSLLEREAKLGGNAFKVFSRDKDVEAYARDLVDMVSKHPLIDLRLSSYPVSSTGFLGNFETRVKGPEGESVIKHGAAILAPGGKQHVPSLYRYGEHPRIVLTLDMDGMLKEDHPALKEGAPIVTFVQCVESRTPQRPYCSRVCCSHSLDSALAILDRNPRARIFFLIREMRSYGFREKKYEEARRRGVIFIRYDLEKLPEVSLSSAGGIVVTAEDQVLHRPLSIETDYLVLAGGVDPAPMKEEIVEVFKGQLNAEGFLLEAHLKLRPVDLATDGQYMAGLAHYPKPVEETIAQARAAAARAAGVLAKPYVMVGGVVAEVDPDKCAACCTCVRACPLRVPKIVGNEKDPALPGHAFMEPAICQGCGVCVGECPGKAIKLCFFSDEQLLAKVGALSGDSLEGEGRGALSLK